MSRRFTAPVTLLIAAALPLACGNGPNDQPDCTQDDEGQRSCFVIDAAPGVRGMQSKSVLRVGEPVPIAVWLEQSSGEPRVVGAFELVVRYTGDHLRVEPVRFGSDPSDWSCTGNPDTGEPVADEPDARRDVQLRCINIESRIRVRSGRALLGIFNVTALTEGEARVDPLLGQASDVFGGFSGSCEADDDPQDCMGITLRIVP